MFDDWCLPHFLWPHCVRCGCPCVRPLCVACRKEPLIEAARHDGCPIWGLSPYRLGGKLSPCAELIHRLKYAEQTCSAASLGWALARHWPKALSNARVVPVPLHPERLVERGYNQSALLSRALVRYASSELSWEVGVLQRRTHARAQAQLDRRARRENLRGAFTALPCPPSLEDRKIILLDDVVTTGATSFACVEALRRADYEVGAIVCCAIST